MRAHCEGVSGKQKTKDFRIGRDECYEFTNVDEQGDDTYFTVKDHGILPSEAANTRQETFLSQAGTSSSLTTDGASVVTRTASIDSTGGSSCRQIAEPMLIQRVCISIYRRMIGELCETAAYGMISHIQLEPVQMCQIARAVVLQSEALMYIPPSRFSLLFLFRHFRFNRIDRV
jgi:hypothetical protein